MKQQKIKSQVQWTPRTANVEADRLANGTTSGFDPARQVKVDAASIHLEILSKALEWVRTLETQDAEDAPEQNEARRTPQRSRSVATQRVLACRSRGVRHIGLSGIGRKDKTQKVKKKARQCGSNCDLILAWSVWGFAFLALIK